MTYDNGSLKICNVCFGDFYFVECKTTWWLQEIYFYNIWFDGDNQLTIAHMYLRCGMEKS
jgi:hypothetical protein